METEVLKKVAEVEALTGKSLIAEISNVPFGNVVTAFRVIPFINIVKMVKSVDLQTLVTGLKIITVHKNRTNRSFSFYSPTIITNE